MKEEMVVVGKKGDIVLARARESETCSTCTKCHGSPRGNFLELHVPEGISVGHRILVDIGHPGLSRDLRILAAAAVAGFLLCTLLVALVHADAREAVYLALGVCGSVLGAFFWRILGKRLEGRPRYVRLLREDQHWEISAATSSTYSNDCGSAMKKAPRPPSPNS